VHTLCNEGGCNRREKKGGLPAPPAPMTCPRQTASEKHSYTEARRKTPGLLSFTGLTLVFAVLPVFNSGLAAYAVFTNLASAGQTSLTLSTLQPLLRALVFRAYFNTLCAGAARIELGYAAARDNPTPLPLSARSLHVCRLRLCCLERTVPEGDQSESRTLAGTSRY
jgi:hypothetical protein